MRTTDHTQSVVGTYNVYQKFWIEPLPMKSNFRFHQNKSRNAIYGSVLFSITEKDKLELPPVRWRLTLKSRTACWKICNFSPALSIELQLISQFPSLASTNS